jgi:hypothetical protein
MNMRDIISLIESTNLTSSWPPRLNDAYEIAEYIDGIAGVEVDTQWMLDYFTGAIAVLRLVDIDTLVEGDPNGNLAIPGQDERYAQMDAASAPPLVVEGGRIIDGNHRYRAAKMRGDKEIWVYDVVDPRAA